MADAGRPVPWPLAGKHGQKAAKQARHRPVERLSPLAEATFSGPSRYLDEDVRRGKGEFCRTGGVDGEEAHVTGSGLQGDESLRLLPRTRRGRLGYEVSAEFAGEIDGHSARFARD